MQIVKPFEINDSNLVSTIAEPDLTQGEAEWIPNRANFFNSIDNFIFGVSVVSDVIYVLAGVDAVTRNVRSYKMDGTPIATFTPLSNTLMSITTDGTDLLLCESASTTSISVYKYSTAGGYIETKVFTFSQSATENDRAICYKDNLFYAHSYTNGAHSTVTAFAYDTTTRLSEYDVNFIQFNPSLGFTFDSNNFYLLNSASELHRISLDFSESSLAFLARVNNKFCSGAHYYSDRFWFASNSISTPQDVGFQFGDGLGFGAYQLGEQAIKTSTHKIYQAVTNTIDDPEVGVLKETPSWEAVSATNKYRAFDYVKNLQSVGASPLVLELTPNSLFSALAVFNISGATAVNVTITDPTAGEVYNEDINLIDVGGIINMWQYYFFQPEGAIIDKFVLDDLPPYKDATVVITFTGTGDIGAGEVALGRSRIIGEMLVGSSTDRKSYSTITVDTFGNESITRRPSATYTSYQVALPTSNADYVDRLLKGALEIPTLFIGNKQNGQKLIDLGYYERSPLVLANHAFSEINLKVRGLV